MHREGGVFLDVILRFVGSWTGKIELGVRGFLSFYVFKPHPFKVILVRKNSFVTSLLSLGFLCALLVGGPEGLVLDNFVLFVAHLAQHLQSFRNALLLKFSLLAIVAQEYRAINRWGAGPMVSRARGITTGSLVLGRHLHLLTGQGFGRLSHTTVVDRATQCSELGVLSFGQLFVPINLLANAAVVAGSKTRDGVEDLQVDLVLKFLLHF